MRLHVGLSGSEDVALAAAEAAGIALRDAHTPAFALVLCTDRYDAGQLATAVSQVLGTIPWAGCCTAGVFAGGDMLEQGIVCGVFSAEHVSFGVGIGGPLSVDARAAGREAASQAVAGLDVRAGTSRTFIVLPDALTGNASEVVRGAAQAAGAGVVWAGGGAGDNLRFIHNAQFAFGRCWRDRVVVIAIDAPHAISVGIRHGWHPYGPAVTVTRASGARANELEYENAFLVYKRIAAARGDTIDEQGFARFAMRHPLGIPQTSGEFVIRDPLAIEPDGSLRCVAEVPDGSIVRVMQGDTADLLAAARAAAVEARLGLDGVAGGAIVFDCVSRSLLLGPDVRDELAQLQEGIGRGVPLMGCLTLGEIGAFGDGAPQFHNKTAVVMALPLSETASVTEPVRVEHAAASDHELKIEPLSIASVLQELTVAALELFDPKQSTEPFLDRVAERLGCYAAVLLELDARGDIYLAGANGLSTASRQLPFPEGASKALADGQTDVRLPYPELASPRLVRWKFPIAADASSAALLLFFRGEPPLSPQLHGMVDRLARILATVLEHRHLFARIAENERRLSMERDAVAAARAAAERANAAKDEFLSVVSHEIRNRLSPVLQWTRLMLDQAVPPERVPHALEVIERNAALQSRLIEDLLDLDRAASGTFRLVLREIDLGALLSEEAELVGLQASKKGVQIHVRTEGDSTVISGDSDRIRQMIANLLENAVKFTPAGGRIDASVTGGPSAVRLIVRDTGRGIPADLIPGIFDVFNRAAPIPADPPEGSRGSGLGIGLALVRRIVETHGGTIRAESEGPDRGATFTIELPAARVR